MRSHESEIILFEATARKLKNLGAVPLPAAESIKKDLTHLPKKETLLDKYQFARSEAQKIETVKQNMDVLLSIPEE